MATIVVGKKHVLGFAAIITLALIVSSFADVGTYMPWHFLQQVAKGPYGAGDQYRSIDENSDGIVDAAQNLSCAIGMCYVNGSIKLTTGAIIFPDGSSQSTASGYSVSSGMIREFTVADHESINEGDIVRLLQGKVVNASYENKTYSSSDQPVTINYFDAAILSEDRFVIVYTTGPAIPYQAFAILATANGREISYGAPELVHSNLRWNSVDVAAVTPTTFAVAVTPQAENTKVMIGDTSVGVIMFGPIADTGIKNQYGFEGIEAMNSNKITVAAHDGACGGAACSYIVRMAVGDVSGSSVVFGAPANAISLHYFAPGQSTGSLGNIVLEKISDSKAVVVYKYSMADGSILPYVGRVVGTLSGSSFSFGPEAQWQKDLTGLSIAPLSDSNYVIASTFISTNERWFLLDSITGNTVTLAHEFPTGITNAGDIAALNNGEFMLSKMPMLHKYSVSSGIKYEYNRTIVQPSLQLGYGSRLYSGENDRVLLLARSGDGKRFISKMIYTDDIIGTALESGTEGVAVPVMMDGILGVYAGLEMGDIYYYDLRTGKMTSSITQNKLGKAISSSEILLEEPLTRWKG